MNFEDIKEQLFEKAKNIWNELQENSTFLSLKERFDNYSSKQKIIFIVPIIGIVLLFFLSIPYSFYSSASENLVIFEENIDLIRELLRLKQEQDQSPISPVPMNSSNIKSQIESSLTNLQLPHDQIDSVTVISPTISFAIPKEVDSKGIRVSLKKLNLTQIVDIGHRLQSIDPNSKMTSLNIEADIENNHYYNVVFEIVGFSLPVLTEELSEETSGKNKPRPFERKRPGQ